MTKIACTACAGALILILLAAWPEPAPAQTACAIRELIAGEARGYAGESVMVEIRGGVSCEVTGFSMAIGHDPTRIRFVDAVPGEFLRNHAGEDLFFQVGGDGEAGYAVVGAIFDLSFPLTVPPTAIERGTVLAVMTYQILAGTPPGVVPLLNRTRTYGAHNPVSNVFSGKPGQEPIEPELSDGAVTIAENPRQVPYRRGDVNQDGSFDISDPVSILVHIFLASPGQLSCEKSADSDDSGELDITDAVRLLGSLFLGDPPPPEPFESCGSDPTPDALGCEAFSRCG